MDDRYAYVIAGAGLAGVSAIQGIRETDPDGLILLIGREPGLPYDRPPLSKGLWLGKKQVEDIHLHDSSFYTEQGVDLDLGGELAAFDPSARTLTTTRGAAYGYGKLLLATGGRPRQLGIPGGDLSALSYYRTLADYTRIRARATAGSSVVVVGGGFIGSEMAAALHSNGVKVTMVFGGPHLADRVFPSDLGRALQAEYVSRGIVVHAEDVPVSFEERSDGIAVSTRSGRVIEADCAVVGIGIEPETALAEKAGLAVDNGIVVDQFQRTSAPDVFAAGDVAAFPYDALGDRRRVEHWDHALNHGRQAGRNMAGEEQAYTYMPYFFSDLFEFGYEAVGDVDSRLSVVADWREENKAGVLYYLADDVVRGVVLCNVWGKVDAARNLIRAGDMVTHDRLIGAIA